MATSSGHAIAPSRGHRIADCFALSCHPSVLLTLHLLCAVAFLFALLADCCFLGFAQLGLASSCAFSLPSSLLWFLPSCPFWQKAACQQLVGQAHLQRATSKASPGAFKQPGSGELLAYCLITISALPLNMWALLVAGAAVLNTFCACLINTYRSQGTLCLATASSTSKKACASYGAD